MIILRSTRWTAVKSSEKEPDTKLGSAVVFYENRLVVMVSWTPQWRGRQSGREIYRHRHFFVFIQFEVCGAPEKWGGGSIGRRRELRIKNVYVHIYVYILPMSDLAVCALPFLPIASLSGELPATSHCTAFPLFSLVYWSWLLDLEVRLWRGHPPPIFKNSRNPAPVDQRLTQLSPSQCELQRQQQVPSPYDAIMHTIICGIVRRPR